MIIQISNVLLNSVSLLYKYKINRFKEQTPNQPSITMSTMLSQDYDMVFKILLIGNSSVGKSSLLLRFADDVFNESFLPTIGVDFKIRTLDSVSGSVVKLQIWDTAGQEKFKTITAAYYKGAQGLILAFDITDRQSFLDVEKWLCEADKYANLNMVKVLVGTKCDLEANREVRREEAEALAQSLGMEYIETSAKTTKNVEKTFMKLSENMKAQFFKQGPKKSNPKDRNVILPIKPTKPKGVCCAV